MVANKYAFLQITRRRFLNEWEAFKKVISRRNIRRRITIPLTLSNLKLLRRITRTENILHRNFTRRQVAIQNRVASNIGISQSTFSVKVLNLFSRSRRKTNKRKSKHSEFSAFHDETGRLNVDGMNIISNDGSNKLNRSRKARVSYKVQRTINASLNAATSTRAVSSNPNFVTRQKIEIIFG